ncbi:hypothetical protein [Dehalogenimonas alkenigignens]|uniref:hypothetical protein n=1 Tax=Dehalogenimonas alkenigignens TaxID=1217799 RepID=UPI000731BE24|nr:hypothetical protein [Dehalogenimonas alkenigignens]
MRCRIHLIVYHLDQFVEVAGGQDVFLDLADDLAFKFRAIEIAAAAGARAFLDDRPASVVGEFAAFGIGSDKGFTAVAAPDQAA